MNCCGHCRGADDLFNLKTAKKDLRRYLRRGPNKSTRLLLNEIRNDNIKGDSLLDIGGGIGSIQLELFPFGLHHSVNVDASSAYQQVSGQEAQKRGYTEHVEYYHGDFTEIASTLAPADIVTLDRVICCYPDVDKLLDKSLQKADKLYGVVFPRKNIFTRIGVRLGNLWFQIRKSDFRTYLHPFQKVDGTIQRHGFRQISHHQTILWNIMLYKKTF